MRKLYALCFLAISGLTYSQNPADRDPSYNVTNQPLNQYFVDDVVRNLKVLPDGKIMNLAADLVKLDNNLLDNSFHLQEVTHTGGFPSIEDFLILPDGKIMISGKFDAYNGTTRRDIARLHPDGSLDTSFNPTFNYSRIPAMVAHTDGTIYLHGDGLKKINANGAIISSFTPATNIAYGRMIVQPDGKLLVFHSVNGNFSNGIHKLSRLNLDGSVDPTFNTATFSIGTNGEPELNKIVFQADGKILVGGRFSTCNGSWSPGLVRLNADGILDTTFETGTSFGVGGIVFDIAVQDDQKILVGGEFTHYNEVAKNHIVRLNPDGTIDESLQAPDAFINHARIYVVALAPDGDIYLGGTYDFDRDYNSYIVRLNPDGTKDPDFTNISKGFFSPRVADVVETEEGKLLVVGNFHLYNDQFCHNFTRLNADGSIDPSLNYGGLSGFLGPDFAYPTAIAKRDDGKIYIAGTFTSYNGAPARSIILINPDGTREMSFDARNGVDPNESSPGKISDILVTPDGGVLVAGSFGTVNWAGNSVADCPGLLKYTATGTVTWSPFSMISGPVTSLAYQPDGKLVVGTYSSGIYRFNADLTLDNTFITNGTGNFHHTNLVEIQPDGKILVRGQYMINGEEKNLLRLNADGSLDNSFNCPFDDTALEINSSKLLPDGKIMINTQVFSPVHVTTIRRLNNDGSIDPTFEQSVYDGGWLEFLTLSTGKLLVYGELQRYQNKPALGMIRLMGETYNFVQGQNRFDGNQNGCDTSDALFSNLKYVVSGGDGDLDFIPNASGNYILGMKNGSYVITPEFENPEYFTASPSSVPVDFPSQASPLQQNFCITANGVHPDLEVLLIPLTDARPGFDARYQLIYKNKGNQVQSGTVTLAFDDASIDVVSAVPSATTSSENLLQWHFSALQPYETRTAVVTFNLNSPSETPALNSGAVLPFTASLQSALTDDTPEDNTFQFNQVVVNSFDPNDKTCLQGEAISASQVGDYVHYVIRFENNGTAPAQDIKIIDIIDTDKYDITSLRPLSGSGLFTTKVVNGNQVEFFFENINLPYADATNDGFVSFKIKTKSNLTAGDSFSNSASIYFDYNLPIVTNTATTTIQTLSAGEFEPTGLSVYPNPARDILHIRNPEGVNFSSISIYNMAGQLIFVRPNAANTNSIDIGHLSAGSYIAVFASGAEKSSVKFIKM